MAREPAPVRRFRIPGKERRKIILDAAMNLFGTRGFHGVSLDEIAAAASITKPVLYDHFSSKEDLYLRVCEEIRERLLQSGREVIAPPQTLSQRLRAGVEAFFVFAGHNPAAIRILLSPPRDVKRLYKAIQKIQDEATQSILATMLQAGVDPAKGEDADLRLTIQVEFIKRGLHALAEWRTFHPAVPIDVVVGAISQLLGQGLLSKQNM